MSSKSKKQNNSSSASAKIITNKNGQNNDHHNQGKHSNKVASKTKTTPEKITGDSKKTNPKSKIANENSKQNNHQGYENSHVKKKNGNQKATISNTVKNQDPNKIDGKQNININKRNNEIKTNNNKLVNTIETSKIINEESEKKDPIISEKNLKKAKTGVFKYIFMALIVLILVGIITSLIFIFRPKFKSITIELGTSKVTINDFLVKKSYKKDSAIKTDISKIDFTKVGEYDIQLTYKDKAKNVKMKIADTIAPTVVFKNVVEYQGYTLDANDFIEEKEDLSEMKVYTLESLDFNEFKDYNVKIIVEDIYGNKTSKTCVLTITWLKPLVYIELGSSFSENDIIVNIQNDGDKVPKSEIKKVDTSKLGEYILSAMYEGTEYQSKVIIQDTTPPELELKDVSIYIGDKVKSKDSFIKKVKDVSGVVTTTMQTTIDYSLIGVQEITIEAVDESGNKISKTAKLTIKKDADGPVFSGLSNLTVEKHESIDYYKGVKAVDAKEGTKEFSVESGSVNTSVAGTYYAVYTAIDNSGNKTTKKRKITVRHNWEDTEAKFNEFYNNYLAGKSTLEMVRVIKTKIKYNGNGGGGDPIWYGLTNFSGDCYVHAMLTKKALDKAGINNRLIYVTNKSHYWNLVEINGVWRHYDSTPGSHIIGPATDDEKYSSSMMQKRNWDRTAFPAAV